VLTLITFTPNTFSTAILISVLLASGATRTEIKIAVEKVFGVKVLSVNTMNREGKNKRTRFGDGKRKDTKRAIVHVAAGDRIDIFGGPVS